MVGRFVIIAVALILTASFSFGQGVHQAQAQEVSCETFIIDGEEVELCMEIVEIVETVGASDRDILNALYDATDGPNWNNNDNWKSDEPLNTWHGVYTDNDGRVYEISLARNGLSGTIPAELGDLSELAWLTLDHNQLTGGIPKELGSLSKLKWLSLDDNQLSGTIPTELGNLSSIRSMLSLSDNQLTGGIPKELSKLTTLDWLDLSDNLLTGNIPPEFGKLTRIHHLYLHGNQLSGTLPTELTQIPVESHLHLIVSDNAGLCAPPDANFQVWLDGIGEYRGATCALEAKRAPSNLSAAMVELDDHDEGEHGDHEGRQAATTPPNDEDDHEIGVYLTWTPGNAPSYVKQVVRRREVGTDGAWTDFDIGVSVSEYTDESVEHGTRYVYRVKAEKSNGRGPITNRVVMNIPADSVLGGLTARAQNGSVTLSWTPSGANDVVKQVVKRREAGVRPVSWTKIDVASSESGYMDTSIQSGKKYIYRVQAVRQNNRQSESSESVSVRVP